MEENIFQEIIKYWGPAVIAMIPGIYAIYRQTRKDFMDLKLQEKKDQEDSKAEEKAYELAARNQEISGAEKLTGTALALIESVNHRLGVVEKELYETKTLLEKQTQRVKVLTNGVHILTKQIRAAGLSPAWADVEEVT